MISIIDQLVRQYIDEAITIRHHIHQHPELRYQEEQTAALVTLELKAYGFSDIKTGVGSTGVTALLDSGKPGPVAALRADMDALPIQEKTGLDYASSIPGKMHACGHDGHTATLLLAARVLKKASHLLPCGKIKFIFQPAEEGGAGAKAMIDDGVLHHPNVDAIFAYHNYPCLPAGQVALRSGCFMAGSCNISITVRGVGTHAANPETGVDPIVTTAMIIQGLQTIVSRNLSPLEQGVLSITQVNAGFANNVIPDKAVLSGTLRATSLETMDILKNKVTSITNNLCHAFNTSAEITYSHNSYPPTINTEHETLVVEKAARELSREHPVKWLNNVIDMGAEDFAFYLQKVPGCYFGIGNGSPEKEVHSQHYDFNDTILPKAAKLLSLSALNFLAAKSSDYL